MVGKASLLTCLPPVAAALIGALAAAAPARAGACNIVHPDAQSGPTPEFTRWNYGDACVIIWRNQRSGPGEIPRRRAECEDIPGMIEFIPDRGANVHACIFRRPGDSARGPDGGRPGGDMNDDEDDEGDDDLPVPRPAPAGPSQADIERQRQEEQRQAEQRLKQQRDQEERDRVNRSFQALLDAAKQDRERKKADHGPTAVPGTRPGGSITGSDRPIDSSTAQTPNPPPPGDPRACVKWQMQRRGPGGFNDYVGINTCPATVILDLRVCDALGDRYVCRVDRHNLFKQGEPIMKSGWDSEPVNTTGCYQQGYGVTCGR